MTEIWKVISGWPNYEVSNLGRVRNITRDYILKPIKQNTGYTQVALSKNDTRKNFSIHRLVASEFIGLPVGMVVNHLDFNKENNALENLQVCTQKENNQHAWDGGAQKSRPGESHHRATTSNNEVLYIRRLSFLGLHDKDISDITGVSQYNVSRIRRRVRWCHI